MPHQVYRRTWLLCSWGWVFSVVVEVEFSVQMSFGSPRDRDFSGCRRTLKGQTLPGTTPSSGMSCCTPLRGEERIRKNKKYLPQIYLNCIHFPKGIYFLTSPGRLSWFSHIFSVLWSAFWEYQRHAAEITRWNVWDIRAGMIMQCLFTFYFHPGSSSVPH